MPRPSSLAVLAAALLGCAATVRAQDEAAFDQACAQVRQLMAKAKWQDAKAAIESLLQAHSKQLYAIASRDGLLEDHRRCAFALAVPVPAAQSLLSGEITFASSSNKLRARYTPKNMGDWEKQGDDAESLLLYPAVFREDFTVVIRGTEYTKTQVLFGIGSGEHWLFDGGLDQGDHGYYPLVLERWNGNAYSNVFQARTGFAPGKFELKLDVKRRSIAAFGLKSKGLVRHTIQEGVVGQVGFFPAPFDEIVLEGVIEPSWFQRVVDAHLATKRAEFDEKYDSKQHLPAWLLEDPATDRTARNHRYYVPGTSNAKDSPALQEAMKATNAGDWRKLQKTVAEAPPDAMQPVTRAFLTALAAQRLGDPEKALVAVEEALKLEPGFTFTRSLQAEVLDDLRRGPEALAVLEKLVADDAGEESVVEHYVVALLQRSRVELAERAVRDAKTKHGLWEEMRPLDQLLAMRRRGPQWTRRHVWTTANYEITSDIDQKVCQEAARILEESLVNLKAQLAWVKDDKEAGRYQVHLFSGEAGYRDYCAKILGTAPSHTAGLYSPVLKQLLIWNLPQREDMERTIRHEGFHQFLDRALVDPPVWFNEGMAEFWETARREKGRFQGGQPRREHVATLLRSRKLVPKTKALVYGSRGDFYASAQLRYAQAWALVHLLRKGPEKQQKLFPPLWQALRGEGSTKAALDKAFAGVDWDALDQAFWSHVQAMTEDR